MYKFSVAQPSVSTRDEPENAWITAERAARWSPHDARAWLVVAGLADQIARAANKAADALKLSYYTGPNSLALVPLRLFVAAGIRWDEELRGMVRADIQHIVLQRPSLKARDCGCLCGSKTIDVASLRAAIKQVDENCFDSTKVQPQGTQRWRSRWFAYRDRIDRRVQEPVRLAVCLRCSIVDLNRWPFPVCTRNRGADGLAHLSAVSDC